jgi:hypothetical protein
MPLRPTSVLPHPSLPMTELVQAIEDHLARHPQAADSPQGVARWWLGARAGQTTAQDVERALATLVARRRLRRVELADGTVLYSRQGPRGDA